MKNIVRLTVVLMLSIFAAGCAIHVYKHDGDSDCRSRCAKKCDKGDCDKPCDKGDCDKSDCGKCCMKGACDKPCDKGGCKKGDCDKPCDKGYKKGDCDKGGDKPCDKGGDEAKEAFGRVTTEELAALIASKSVTVIDNNRPEIFAEGRIPGAKHIIWKDVTADKLPKNKNAKLVFYCANPQCMACHKAADAAIALGYTDVHIYPDGIQGWKDAGQKVEK